MKITSYPARGQTDQLLYNFSRFALCLALACGAASQACKRRTFVDAVLSPPPAGVCVDPQASQLSLSIHPHAQWVKSAKHWTIALTVHIDSAENRMWFGWLKRENVEVSGATLESMTLQPQDVEIVLVPFDGRSDTVISMPILCGQEHIRLKIKLDLRGPRKKRAYIPTKLVD